MKLLLAIDGSKASQNALDGVATRPWPAGSSIEVLTVTEPPHLWAMSETEEQVAVRAHQLVNNALQQLQANGVQATGTAVSGDPKRTILQHAATADMVVLGSHGSAPLTSFLLGNVAAAVVRYAPCSVEIVRGNSGIRRVLLATDGSAHAAAAARSIASRPWPAGTEFRILSVVELVLPPVQALIEPAFLHLTNVEERREDAMRQAEDAIDEALKILGPGATTSISVLLDGPKKVIVDEARSWAADLIVMGSHGRSGIDHFLMGSVSEAVALHAPCSVDVIRAR